jgi:hypothetical protein
VIDVGSSTCSEWPWCSALEGMIDKHPVVDSPNLPAQLEAFELKRAGRERTSPATSKISL